MEFHPPTAPTAQVIPVNDVIPTGHPWTQPPIRKHLSMLTQEQVEAFVRVGLLVIVENKYGRMMNLNCCWNLSI